MRLIMRLVPSLLDAFGVLALSICFVVGSSALRADEPLSPECGCDSTCSYCGPPASICPSDFCPACTCYVIYEWWCDCQ